MTVNDGSEVENARRFEMDKTVLITMGDDEDSRSGAFEIEMLYEEDKELGIGLFATPYGQARNNEASPWNLFAVQPVRWSICNGECKLIAGIGFRKYDITEPVNVLLEKGRYHKFKMESDGENIFCYIDGEKVMEAELTHYDEIQTIALEDGDNVILKIVNIAEKENTLQINMDCEVDTKYRIGTISGETSDKNTMDNPEKVVDVWKEGEGASKCFKHSVPGNSITVLVFKQIN